jgi:hypothetical protein
VYSIIVNTIYDTVVNYYTVSYVRFELSNLH